MKNITIIFTALVTLAMPSVGCAQINKGDLAPDFTVSNPQDKKINLYDLKGKTIILDFWASWCGPCRMANPDLVRLYKQYHPLGLEVFSVSLDTKKEPWLKAIEKDKLIWPYHGADLKGWESLPVMLYSVQAVPTSILLDDNLIVQLRTFDIKELELKLKAIYYDQVNVYPLTTAGIINFSAKSKFQIFDSTSVEVFQGKGEQADISTLKQGNYRVMFEERTEFITKINPPTEKAIPVVLPNISISFATPTSAQLYMSNGHLIGKYTSSKIDLTNLPSGKYWLEINGILTSIEKSKK